MSSNGRKDHENQNASNKSELVRINVNPPENTTRNRNVKRESDDDDENERETASLLGKHGQITSTNQNYQSVQNVQTSSSLRNDKHSSNRGGINTTKVNNSKYQQYPVKKYTQSSSRQSSDESGGGTDDIVHSALLGDHMDPISKNLSSSSPTYITRKREDEKKYCPVPSPKQYHIQKNHQNNKSEEEEDLISQFHDELGVESSSSDESEEKDDDQYSNEKEIENMSHVKSNVDNDDNDDGDDDGGDDDDDDGNENYTKGRGHQNMENDNLVDYPNEQQVPLQGSGEKIGKNDHSFHYQQHRVFEDPKKGLYKVSVNSAKEKQGNLIKGRKNLERKTSLGSSDDSFLSSSVKSMTEMQSDQKRKKMKKKKKKVKKNKTRRIPEPGTNIADVRSRVNFQDSVKRFILIGLEYECWVFYDVDTVWNKIKVSFARRLKERSEMKLQNGEELEFEPIWIDIQNPSTDDLHKIQKYFYLHPLTVEDCINGDTGEKWELFEHYMFVVFTAQIDSDILSEEEETTQLNVIIFKNYVLTIHSKPVKGLELVMKRVETEFEKKIDNELFNPPTLQPFSVINMSTNEATNIPGSRKKKKKLVSSRISSFANTPTNVSDSMRSYKYDVERTNQKYKTTGRTPNSLDDIISIASHPDRDESSTKSKMKQQKSYNELTMIKKTEIPSPDWILYALLDAMVDSLLPFVDGLVDEVEHLDDLVMLLHQRDRDDLLSRIGLGKKSITTLRRFFLPKHKMAAYLVSRRNRFILPDTQVYIRDILDHLTISLEKLDYVRESLNQTHSNYMTKVSMEIAASANRTDIFISRITVLATLISPLALISGIWGMNVKVPGQDADNLYWFFGIVGSMVITTLMMIVLLRKKLT